MAKRTGTLADMPPISGSEKSLRRMAREVQAMLKDVLDAYIRRDAELAMDRQAHAPAHRDAVPD